MVEFMVFGIVKGILIFIDVNWLFNLFKKKDKRIKFRISIEVYCIVKEIEY